MRISFKIAGALALGVALLLEPAGVLPFGASKATAEVGRPLTPVSVAGVSRRTTRRTTRRVEYRNSVAGCSPYQSYYNCGGVYYAPQMQNGTTVYVVVNP